jgi:hypothetical protein
MSNNQLISTVDIERRIYLVRGQRVMLDRNLAELYGVTTAALNQAVRRNLDRFPQDFMFQLDKKKFEDWRSHPASDLAEKSRRTLVRRTPGLQLPIGQ